MSSIYYYLAGFLFTLGLLGTIFKKDLISILLCLEMMMGGVSLLIILGVFALIINNNIEVLAVNNIADNSMLLMFDKLFHVYYLPFEMATVLLLAALVACVVITGHEKNAKVELEGDKHE